MRDSIFFFCPLSFVRFVHYCSCLVHLLFLPIYYLIILFTALLLAKFARRYLCIIGSLSLASVRPIIARVFIISSLGRISCSLLPTYFELASGGSFCHDVNTLSWHFAHPTVSGLLPFCQHLRPSSLSSLFGCDCRYCHFISIFAVIVIIATTPTITSPPFVHRSSLVLLVSAFIPLMF